MGVEEVTDDDMQAVTALWGEVGLTRPWNDPESDFRRARKGPSSAILGVKQNGALVGSVMVGHDGHRGWVYYLAVAPARQRQGLGRELMSAAEEWLRDRGAVKIQLMVRNENTSMRHFYERCGYQESDVVVLAKWLNA
jgi:ribosomal protein S18 acetylase RimI-like enzyme